MHSKIERKRININMFDLITSLTNAADLVKPELANHHLQVAYLAFRIAEQLNLPIEKRKNLLLAGLIHDLGAISVQERLEFIENEPASVNDHAFRGAKLIEEFPPLEEAANIIRYHHIPWDYGQGKVFCGENVSILSHIIHLADRIAILINPEFAVLGQVENIKNSILQRNHVIFKPDLVDGFLSLSNQEYIWLDLNSFNLLETTRNLLVFDSMDLNLDEVIGLTKIFAKIIDSRSPFTANHSKGVAKTAEKLAELAGFSENECKMILIAGYLHDLGKLAIDNEVLEKPGQLNTEEYNIIRSHAYYTYRLLQPIKGFETINNWAALHHEKLNGKGYPFHLFAKDISLGSRIMAVADIFTALTENRPYRVGMTKIETIKVINNLVLSQSICPYIVTILIDNYDLLNNIRIKAQQEATI